MSTFDNYRRSSFDDRSSERPYASRGGASLLTPREKKARAIRKTAEFSADSVGGSNTVLAGAGQFFSPQLSTDFLELPQSLRERREIYRHFYNTDPLVGQSIDLHTEIPLSKVRLARPKPRTCPKGFKDPDDYGAYILRFFERMCKKVHLFQTLIQATHHYWLDGNVFIWAEDSDVEVPSEVSYERKVEKKKTLTDEGEAKEEEEENWVEKEDMEEQEQSYYHKHYQGWRRLVILPVDQVKITTFSFTDKVQVDLIPSERDRALIERAKTGDPVAEKMVEEMPSEVREHIEQSRLIPLGTDPDEGSFVYHLAGRRGAGEELGQSILDRCHLPGTPVLALRDGYARRVLIEELNPETDKVLGGSGEWRAFTMGFRPVSDEPVAEIRVLGLSGSIKCTADHRYPVLREGQWVKVLARDIQPGDALAVPSVALPETLKRLDVVKEYQGLNETYIRSDSQKTPIKTELLEVTEENITLQYSRSIPNTPDVDRMNSILELAGTLDNPAIIYPKDLAEWVQANRSALYDIRRKLAKIGYATPLKMGGILLTPLPPGYSLERLRQLPRKYPRYIDLDHDSGYLVGSYLGVGCVVHGPVTPMGRMTIPYRCTTGWFQDQVKVTRRAMERLGIAVSDTVVGSRHSWRLLLGVHDLIPRWFAKNFGSKGSEKCIPSWVMEAPKDFLWGLLHGLFDSCGGVLAREDGTASIRLVLQKHPELADQVFLICTSLGIPAMLSQAVGSLGSKRQDPWVIHFDDPEMLRRFTSSGWSGRASLLPEAPDLVERHYSVSDGKFCYHVKSVGISTYSGDVHSLDVDEDHTFYANGALTHNCLRTLYFREKLRQAQTQIASRAMTPKRIVWSEGLSADDTEQLREQVDLSLVDPDYTIVTNYELHWEEMGSRDRLLDLSSEYEQTDKQLYAGLGVTDSLLSGESFYSGDRVKLEVINTRYLLYREMIQEFVEECLFKPVARRKGFVEEDEWGDEEILFPKLSFTRLPLRDSQDTFDALYNLYQKGSIDVGVILEMLNIDPADTKMKIEHDLFTVNDSVFNEAMRGLYGEVGRVLVEKTDIVKKLASYLKLEIKAEEAPAEESRF